ncbi:NAD(P)-binding protein [Cryobacterium sp. 10S3]
MGGGWSGIASAWYLHRAGFRVDLYDSGRSLGAGLPLRRLAIRT